MVEDEREHLLGAPPAGGRVTKPWSARFAEVTRRQRPLSTRAVLVLCAAMVGVGLLGRGLMPKATPAHRTPAQDPAPAGTPASAPVKPREGGGLAWMQSQRQQEAASRTRREEELSCAVEGIAGVASAKVFLEPPAASVWLRTADDQPLPQGKVDAIASLIGGGAAGVKPSLVRIVERSGLVRRSWSQEDARLALHAEACARAERALVERAERLLGDIPGVRVAAWVSPPTPAGAASIGVFSQEHTSPTDARLTVSVPEEYVETLTGCEDTQAAREHFEAIVKPYVRTLLTPEVATLWAHTAPDEEAVRVVMTPRRASVAVAPPASHKPGLAERAAWMLAGCSLVGMVFGAGAFAIWSARRAAERRRWAGEMSEEEIAARAGDTQPVEAWEADPSLREARAWALIGDARAEDVAGALALEAPDAVASALLQLSERVPGSMAMAGKVLRLLPEDRRVEVVNTLASGDVSDEIPGLAERLADGVEEHRQRSQRRLRGARLAAAVLEAGSEQVRGGVLRALAQRDPSLVEAIRGPVSFDDLLGLDDDDALVAVLQHAQENDLVHALWSSEPDVRERVLRLMPPTSSRRLRQRIGELRAVRVADIETARARLAALARQGWPGQGTQEVEQDNAPRPAAGDAADGSAQVAVLEGR